VPRIAANCRIEITYARRSDGELDGQHSTLSKPLGVLVYLAMNGPCPADASRAVWKGEKTVHANVALKSTSSEKKLSSSDYNEGKRRRFCAYDAQSRLYGCLSRRCGRLLAHERAQPVVLESGTCLNWTSAFYL